VLCIKMTDYISENVLLGNQVQLIKYNYTLDQVIFINNLSENEKKKRLIFYVQGRELEAVKSKSLYAILHSDNT